MKKKNILPLLFFLTTFTTTAQPIMQWQNHFGGTNNDYASSIIATNDGYLVAGTTASSDGDVEDKYTYNDGWLVKLNKAGNKMWAKTYGTDGNIVLHKIIKANDNGYILMGEYPTAKGQINYGSKALLLIKIDKDGNELWRKIHKGKDENVGYAITQSNDGGYVITGHTFSTNFPNYMYLGGKEMWIIKVDNSGELQWQKAYGGNYTEQGFGICKGNDGGYLVAGFSQSTNEKKGDVKAHISSDDGWIIKLDENGKLLWQKIIGGKGSEKFYTVIPNQNGYLLFGENDMTDKKNGIVERKGSTDIWLVQIDNTGNQLWKKHIGGGNKEFFNQATKLNNGSILICARTRSTDGDVKGNTKTDAATYWFVCISQKGYIKWQLPVTTPNIGRTGRGSGVYKSRAPSATQDADGNIAVAGFCKYPNPNANKTTTEEKPEKKKSFMDKMMDDSPSEESYYFWIAKFNF